MGSNESTAIVTFFLNDELYAIPLSDIREVNRMAGIRTVPKAPSYVVGLLNLHGLTSPVLNLKRLLRIEPSELARNSRWVAVKHESFPVCLAVDQLDRIIEVSCEKLDEAPALSKGPETQYLKCCARIDAAIVPVLEVNNLLEEKEKRVLAEILNKNDDPTAATENPSKQG